MVAIHFIAAFLVWAFVGLTVSALVDRYDPWTDQKGKRTPPPGGLVFFLTLVWPLAAGWLLTCVAYHVIKPYFFMVSGYKE